VTSVTGQTPIIRSNTAAAAQRQSFTVERNAQDAAYLGPDKFLTTSHYDTHPVVLIRREAIDTDELTEVICDSMAPSGTAIADKRLELRPRATRAEGGTAIGRSSPGLRSQAEQGRILVGALLHRLHHDILLCWGLPAQVGSPAWESCAHPR
jgi:hypothetical protein